jgi:hypothetical protein
MVWGLSLPFHFSLLPLTYSRKEGVYGKDAKQASVFAVGGAFVGFAYFIGWLDRF